MNSASPASLRGSLQPESLGARGVEHFGRNPQCGRLAFITAAQVKPETILTTVYGLPNEREPAQTALAVGNKLEKLLFKEGAARLLQLYRDEGRLGNDERRVVNMEKQVPGTGVSELAKRRRATERLLMRKLRGDPDAPHVIIKGRLEVEVMGARHGIEPDFLVASSADPFYTVGEVKSYPDRAGKTDPADIRGACRQAAVGVVGLRQTLVRHGMPDPEQVAPAEGDLVLRRTGSLYTTLRPMSLRRETETLASALRELPVLYRQVVARITGTLDEAATVTSIPNRYRESCKEFCALAPVCKSQAIQAGDPAILGDQAQEALAGAGSCYRALELMQGAGPAPQTVAETHLQYRLQFADAAYREALTYV